MKNDERIESIETINDIENTAQNAETAVESTENDVSTSLFDENHVEEPIIEIRHLGKISVTTKCSKTSISTCTKAM